MHLIISEGVRERFPELKVAVVSVRDVDVEAENKLDALRDEVVQWVHSTYDLDSLKDAHPFRAYRDFFWTLGIDPTKIRPASEALIRRVLRGKSIPRINPLVDAYNLASIKTGVPLAAFDLDKLRGCLVMRFAGEGEEFLGIGMKKPFRLKGGELVISDEEKLVAIYPYRDSEQAKITSETKNVLIVSCGVPGVEEERLIKAAETAVSYITRFCGGTAGEIIIV